jgi:hypothetical protein
MEALYRHTDLETRFGLNMNVLDADQTPRVMNLREVLQAFLDHRHEGPPAGQDRATAGDPRRFPDRLSEYRRDHPHRP